MQFHNADNETRIIFEAGSFDDIPDLINGRSYCVVSYGEPYFAALINRLAVKAGVALFVIDDVAPNPDFVLLGKQASRLLSLQRQPEVFVAIGGGSVIDTAKVLASAGGNFELVRSYLVTKTGEDGLANTPIIAVPTTAGTGSEVTCWATVWDNVSKKKYSLNRHALYPEHAVIDPELMLAKPLALTISTGLDALSHALESIWNINATKVSVDFAIDAATEILDVLPKLANDLGSLELRTRMAGATLTSGLAFSRTKTAIAHSISYPISLNHNVVHGIACSFTLPIVLHSISDDEGLCGTSLRQIFGDDLKAASHHLTRFLTNLGISVKLADYGIDMDEWHSIVADAFDGERGLNFIGTQEKFLQSAKLLDID